jgi:hypothetical protein
MRITSCDRYCERALVSRACSLAFTLSTTKARLSPALQGFGGSSVADTTFKSCITCRLQHTTQLIITSCVAPVMPQLKEIQESVLLLMHLAACSNKIRWSQNAPSLENEHGSMKIPA